ncbi:MAG: YncE family protein [Chitinophagaceae bacterium]|nr:MAG: YncE family protein [Chitinophagaceae bacterium]
MKIKIKANTFLIALISISGLFTSCSGQETFGNQYLKLEKVIPLPGVKGRIDHMDVNVNEKERIVYASALGNNSLEVVSLLQGKVIHTIGGLSEPQGVAYLPKQHEIFVANGGNGDCYFYDAGTFKKTGAVHLPSDADDVRYDSIQGKIYVGYGEGGMAIIDAVTKRLTGDIKLPAHPESFQLDIPSGRIWVNIPEAGMIAMLDEKNQKITAEWRIHYPSAYFPMAYDKKDHRLFVGCRRPARLLILNSENGKEIATYLCTGDPDDLYYDSSSRRILISGGEGYVDIFQQQHADVYRQISYLPSRAGARTSLWIPTSKEWLIAAPARLGHTAALLVYKMSN